MASSSPSKEEEKKKVMVPRRKLQSVPDLLANGVNDEDVSPPESFLSKASWMVFLLVLFYASLDFFLRIAKKRDETGGRGGGGGLSEL